MIFQTTHLGQPLWLNLLPANWAAGMSIKHTLETQIEEGLSVRENRRPVYEAYRATVKTALLPKGGEAAAFTAMMAVLKNEYVGIPLYPDILRPARWGERIYDAEFIVAFGKSKADGFQIAHRSAVQTINPAFPYWAPLLVGRYEKRPELSALSGKLGSVKFTFVENSPWGYRIFPAYDETSLAKDWPADRITADWEKSPVEFTDDILEYKTLGKGRVVQVDGQEGVIRRGQELTATLPSRAALRALLNFHLARKGRVQSFTMPWLYNPAAAAPGATRVRFATDDIELKFLSGNMAATTFRVLELPWEITPVDGEQPAQPGKRFLYRFTLDVPGGPVVYRYTDYERDLVRNENGDNATYLSAAIEHDKITQGSNLDDNAPKLKSWFWKNHPWMRYVDETIEAPLALEIFECDPQLPGEAELRFIGDIDDVDPEGRSLVANTTVLGSLLETKVPAFYVQSLCNHDPFSPECGMRDTDYICTGTITRLNGNTVEIAITGNPGNRPLNDTWFAGGWISAGLGELYQARGIRSSAGGAGTQTLVIKRPFAGINVGETVSLCPTCPGTCEACVKKFNNLLNYGGHPHIVPDSPSLPTRNTAASGGKK